MSLIIAGIDEAGYGPLLGPLCVGLGVFHVENWSHGEPAPCLWKLLGAAVRRHGGKKTAAKSAAKKILYDDSKKLKLANDLSPTTKDGRKRHPVMHLEMGVLAMLACISRSETGEEVEAAPAWRCPAHDAELLELLGVALPPEPWYGSHTTYSCETGSATPEQDGVAHPVSQSSDYPRGCTSGEVLISANLLRRAAGGAGVRVLGVRCEAMGEGEFNAILDRFGSKAAATEEALGRHLRRVWREFGAHMPEHGGPRVVCDRQGGRIQYAELLDRALRGECRGVKVSIAEERPERSRYLVEGTGEDGVERALTVLLMPEAETAHLPVALASMTAKLVRETLMERFNRAWCARMPELKPTAGYTQDARRWLTDARSILDAETRRQLVRRA